MKRILITFGLVLLFRLGTMITLPGATVTAEDYFDQGSFLGILNLLGGGGLSTFSLFALGVTPYITASIIVQLLSSDVIPPLARLNKQGEKGRIKVEKITRLVALFFAVLQGLAIVISMINSGYVTADLFGYTGWANILVFTLFLVAGTFVSMWIADQITMKGVGNGTSMIIFIGIIAGIPNQITQSWKFMVPEGGGSIVLVGIMNFFFFQVLGLIFIFIMGFFETSERRIPIQQTGQGLNLLKEKETYLPTKINPAGIVPVIFASAIITLPPTIAQFFPDTSAGKYWVETWFALTHWFGLSVYALLIIGFTFFYSQININPEETASNFQKSSTFIMGVKPGKDTEDYLRRTLNSMSLIGSTVLTLIAISPYLMTFMGIPESVAVGGTAMIIMVSVAIDTWEQVKARALAGQEKQALGKTKKVRKFGEIRTVTKAEKDGDLIF